MRAVGYFSEFPGRRADAPRGASLSQQNDDFLAYCDANGYEPAAAFLDPSGDGERPGLRQLLKYLSRPEKGFLVVVAASFERLGAGATEAARAYFQITASGARVISMEEGALDEARMLKLWSAQRASSGVGERVREAMRRLAVQGQVLGRPPYGYRAGADGRLAIVEDEAALLRHIFRLYLREGLGIRRIAKRLNEEGYRTRRDGNWSMVTIRDLLRNRVYLGTYARFGVRVPSNHTAIVSVSDFDAVEERMQGRRRPAAPARPSHFLLSGLVHCNDGGTRMIGVTRRQQWTRRDGEVVKSTYRYYQSEARTNQSVGAYHTQRADDLEAEVVRHLTGEASGALQSTVVSAGDSKAVAAETAMAEARVRSRMRSLDRQLSGSLGLAAGGRLRPEQLRETAHEVAGEYLLAEADLATLAHRAEAQASDSDRRRHQEQQRERVRSEWGRLPFEERQALVRDLVDKVLVDDDRVRTILRP